MSEREHVLERISVVSDSEIGVVLSDIHNLFPAENNRSAAEKQEALAKLKATIRPSEDEHDSDIDYDEYDKKVLMQELKKKHENID